MPIQLDCPRCNTRLQVPSKKAGGYVNCPQCKGRVWVEKNAASAPPGPMPIPPVAPPPAKSALEKGATAGLTGSVSPLPVPDKPAVAPPRAAPPPPPPAPRKKVARFIAAEAADSTLRLAADGKLPELHLEEGPSKEKPDAESSSNPLALIGGLCVAALLWVALIFSLIQSPGSPAGERKDQARAKIEREFFGTSAIEDKAPAPYQLLLREAQRAYVRGDDKTERACYRKVLDMLRAERGVHEKGLTGRRSRDKELEEAISVLLEN